MTPLTVGVRCLVWSSRRTLFKRLLFTILAPPSPRHCSCPLSSPPLLFLSTLTFYPFGPSPVLLSFLLVCITTSKLLPITIMEWGLDVRRRRLANMYIQRNHHHLSLSGYQHLHNLTDWRVSSCNTYPSPSPCLAFANMTSLYFSTLHTPSPLATYWARNYYLSWIA